MTGRARDNRANSAGRGYDRRWRKARATFLMNHPMCVMCQAQGKTTAASVVDHRIPHKGNTRLFWDRKNWQPLCKPCHDRHKARQEHTGTLQGAGADGLPLDSGHHWNTTGD